MPAASSRSSRWSSAERTADGRASQTRWSDYKVLHQVGEVAAPGISDQPACHSWIEAQQVHDDLLESVGVARHVERHAQLVPGVGVHGLERRRLLKRRGGFAVLPELGVREAEAVPGAVDLGVQAGGFAELV